jgi:uncharacterized tellurite resistance protein B-like protein
MRLGCCFLLRAAGKSGVICGATCDVYQRECQFSITANDCKCYLRSLHKIAASDGEITAAEEEYLAITANRLGVSIEDIEAYDESEPWTGIADPLPQRVLVKDLMFMSHADGRIDAGEETVLAKVIAAYRMPAHVVAEIEAFVKRGKEWIEEGVRLFGSSQYL